MSMGITGHGRFKGKSIVVTGGASGIGRATVERFLAEGACVLFADIVEERGRAVESQLRQDPSRSDRVFFQAADVSVEADNAALVATAINRFGRIDVFYANAGITGPFKPLLEHDVEEWDFVFGVLLRGVFLAIKHAGAAMIAQGEGGSIISTASVAGLVGGGGPVPYSAAKAGVISLTRSAAVELAPYNIRVNSVCPGAILTGITDGSGVSRETLARMIEKITPLPTYGKPEHIASVVAFLASEDASFVTGESIVADGGLIAEGLRVPSRMAAAFTATTT
jgi:NAD(P)-dependent dehydrogenase (short-subunit alcohol dehydrogenase family)